MILNLITDVYNKFQITTWAKQSTHPQDHMRN